MGEKICGANFSQNLCQVKLYSRVYGARMNLDSAKSLIFENSEKSICYNAASFGIFRASCLKTRRRK